MKGILEISIRIPGRTCILIALKNYQFALRRLPGLWKSDN